MALLGYTGHSHCSLLVKEEVAQHNQGSLSHSIVQLCIYILVAIVIYIVPHVITTFLSQKHVFYNKLQQYWSHLVDALLEGNDTHLFRITDDIDACPHLSRTNECNANSHHITIYAECIYCSETSQFLVIFQGYITEFHFSYAPTLHHLFINVL